MDSIFETFKDWIKSKDYEWEKHGVIIDEIIETTHAHQIHVNSHSKIGFGHIGLYESNNIYWVEFEATAREFEDFYKYFEFDILPDFKDVVINYLQFLTA